MHLIGNGSILLELLISLTNHRKVVGIVVKLLPFYYNCMFANCIAYSPKENKWEASTMEIADEAVSFDYIVIDNIL